MLVTTMLARVLLLSCISTAVCLWLYAKVVFPLDPLLLYLAVTALTAGALIIEKLTNCLAELSVRLPDYAPRGFCPACS